MELTQLFILFRILLKIHFTKIAKKYFKALSANIKPLSVMLAFQTYLFLTVLYVKKSSEAKESSCPYSLLHMNDEVLVRFEVVFQEQADISLFEFLDLLRNFNEVAYMFMALKTFTTLKKITETTFIELSIDLNPFIAIWTVRENIQNGVSLGHLLSFLMMFVDGVC